MAVPDRIVDLGADPLAGAAALRWTVPGDGGSPITGHQVRVDLGAWTDTGSALGAHTVDGLEIGREYAFEARAVNADGPAPPSNVARATPAHPRTDTSNDVPSLLPPNASALERAAEQATARIGRVPVPIGDVWDPDACPEPLLPWLAWALSVDRWDPEWPEETKRAVIAASIPAHRRRGTLAAVKAALEDIGAVYGVTENPGGVPGRLDIDILNSGSLLTADLADVRAQIDTSKRYSVHYDLRHSAGIGMTLGFAVGVAAVTVADLAMDA